MKRLISAVVFMSALALVGCESVYYSAWEKMGVHKRDILVDRIEDTQEAQEDTQEQFKDALEQYRALVDFDGGDLAKYYDRLAKEYEASEDQAKEIGRHIDAVENVAEALFDEWAEELDLYTNDRLRRDSARQLKETQRQYQTLLASMRRAQKSVDPVLNTLRDTTMHLKHKLNARAIDGLKGELAIIDEDVTTLVREMQRSIDEANRFINAIKTGG